MLQSRQRGSHLNKPQQLQITRLNQRLKMVDPSDPSHLQPHHFHLHHPLLSLHYHHDHNEVHILLLKQIWLSRSPQKQDIWGYFQCFLPVFKVSQQSSSCRWLWGYWWCLDSRRLFISHWVKGKKVKLSFSLSKHTSFYMLKNEAFHYLDNSFCHNLVSWNRSAVERRRSCVDWKPADWRSEFHYWSQSVCICGF